MHLGGWSFEYGIEKYYFLDFLYTSTNQNKPKLRRRKPRPPKKIPIELSVLATSTGIFTPPKDLIMIY
jgi:hypothetical protein